jgi:beta-lactamase class A
MKASPSRIFLGVLAAALAAAASAGPALAEGRIGQLKKHIEAVSADKVGKVGVAAKCLETGEELVINGDMTFPMASTFKLPVLVEALAQVKEGKFKLDDEISILPADQHLGSGMLASLVAPGIKLSVRNVIQLMMMISDNSAADIMLAKVGAENVNQRLQSYGLQGIRVDRSCQELILDTLGLDPKAYEGKGPAEIEAAVAKLEASQPGWLEKVGEDFSKNPKDQATPRAMNTLLEKLYKKEILDAESCDLALKIMFGCDTGAKRIKGLLPAGTAVAHKTGTIGGTANDVGIIVLPDGLGHVALSVLCKDFTLPTEDVEKIISQIGRYVYDYYTFQE